MTNRDNTAVERTDREELLRYLASRLEVVAVELQCENTEAAGDELYNVALAIQEALDE